MSGTTRRDEPDLEKLDQRSLQRHVRAWAEFRLAECSLRELAVEIGISKSALGVFAAGDAIPEKNWPKLRFWFLEDRKRRRHSLQNPASMVLLIEEVLSNIPAAERPKAIAQTVEHLAALHREAFAPLPEWLNALARSPSGGAP